MKALSEQVVIALNNAGLRRLVKNLSVTDEKSGLLKRASYIDLLLAESKRAAQNAAPLSVLLMQFGKAAAMVKEHGEAEVGAAMERIGQLFTANIRSNDLAFRYGTTSIAIILGDTAEKEGMMAVEKLRKVIADVRLPGKGAKGQLMQFSAGLAQAVIQQDYDPIDIGSYQPRGTRAGDCIGARAGKGCGSGGGFGGGSRGVELSSFPKSTSPRRHRGTEKSGSLTSASGGCLLFLAEYGIWR